MCSQSAVSSKLYAKDLKAANTYFDSEDYINAINLYRKVIAINPNHEIANLNSAISRIRLNQSPDSSLINLSKIKSSTTPEVQFYFGKIFHLTNNFDQAITCYTKYKNIPIKHRSISND